MSIVTVTTLILSGCPSSFSNGSSAPPPSAFTSNAGDGRVKLTWTASPGVEYWIFAATDSSITTTNWSGLANAVSFVNTATPFYMCGLFDGTPYYFTANGRTNGGPGGSGSPTVSSTPYRAGSSWAVNPSILGTPNLYGMGYAGLTTCSNNATSAAGSFAAVGAGGVIYSSSDGQNWNTYAPPSPTDLYAVTGYAANQNNQANPGLRWVAVGAGGESVYSIDGIAWAVGNPSNSNSQANPNNYALRSVTHNGATFFAAGDTGTILSSTDGITWASHVSGTVNNLRGITHGGVYVTVGDNGTILTSGDGNTWTAHTSGTTNILRQVTSIGSIIVAVGDGGVIVTSKDGGANWASQTLPGGTQSLVGVAAESQYVINAIADPSLGFIASAQFVTVDSAGNAYTSTNGLTWSGAILTGTANLNAMVSSGFGFVSAGNAGATASAF
jgi:hypothetical protein